MGKYFLQLLGKHGCGGVNVDLLLKVLFGNKKTLNLKFRR